MKIQIMGILNVTPDSLYDGGAYRSLEVVINKAEAMVRDGADCIDVGGESSRPGAEPVSLEEELRRVVPVVRALAGEFKVPISIDSYKPAVARAAVDVGATIVNDITGFRSPQMAKLLLNQALQGVLMHMQGEPRTMQQAPHYDNVLREIHDFFSQRLQALMEMGIRREQIILDPGIGFGKRLVDNLLVQKHLGEFLKFGCEILLGASRKSFIGQLLDLPVQERLEGSLAAAVMAVVNGARYLRVHDVAATARAVKVAQAIIQGHG